MRRAEKSLFYANNMQQHMAITVLAASPAGLHSHSILPVKSLLNPFPRQKIRPITTNRGLISLPDCCAHFKGTDQRQGEGAAWMLKCLSESQWWWLPSIAFCGFKSQSIPHASSQSVPTCWQEKNIEKKKKGGGGAALIFLYKRTLKKWNSEHTFKIGLRKGQCQ